MRGSAISRWCQWFRLLQGFKVALSRSHPFFLCHLLPSTMVTGFSFYERRSTMVTRDRGWKDEVDILSRLLCILQSFKAILWYFPSLCLCSCHLWLLFSLCFVSANVLRLLSHHHFLAPFSISPSSSASCSSTLFKPSLSPSPLVQGLSFITSVLLCSLKLGTPTSHCSFSFKKWLS